MPTLGTQPWRKARRTGPCAVAGCKGVARWLPSSAFCLRHRARQYRLGHPTMKLPPITELKPYRATIARTLSKHSASPTVAWAQKAVTELLNYRATQGYTTELWTEARMASLKATGVRPMVLLQRLVELYALQRDRPNLFANPKVWFAFLGRRFLTIGRQRIVPPTSGAVHLRHAGQVIEDVLGSFARATLMRMDRDAEADKASRKALNDFAVGA
jgi:hypothetical protein